LIQAPGKGNADDWWAISPLAPDEKTPSFHMNSSAQGVGRWYCHSTGQGGGVLELVQKLQGGNIYEAGRWLLDHQCSHRCGSPTPGISGGFSSVSAIVERQIARSEKERSPGPPENKPIRQSLLPLLTQQGSHPDFKRRGISAATCDYLGCGYLPNTSKSSLKERLVFQVRGLAPDGDGHKPVILTHIGRAVTPAQAEADGKWMFYKGFHKTRELYNIDQALLDPEAAEQIRSTGRLLMVEGPFDVAQCVEAGIKNVVASFGSKLNPHQLPLLDILRDQLGLAEVMVWYDRDPAGIAGQSDAYEQLKEAGFKARAFAWDQSFPSPAGDVVPIPETLTDPGDFTTRQLQWLRRQDVI
jgi:DNA primase